MKGVGPSQSFPKTLRLLRRPEFRRVYEEGRRGSARVCTIFYRSNGLPRTRLGITTPRALGKAVVRNRIRRRLREVFRLNQAAIPPGWDIVLNPAPLLQTFLSRFWFAKFCVYFQKNHPQTSLDSLACDSAYGSLIDSHLSGLFFASFSPRLPLSTHVLRLCLRGRSGMGSLEWPWDFLAAPFKMPSLWRVRL